MAKANGRSAPLADECARIAAAARRLAAAEGLVAGTAGNVSARADDLVAIAPTGATLAEMEPEHVAVVRLDGQQRSAVVTAAVERLYGTRHKVEP